MIFCLGDLVKAPSYSWFKPGLVVDVQMYGQEGEDLLKIPQYTVRWNYEEHTFLPIDLEVWPSDRKD
jgi:hypothetical protein